MKSPWVARGRYDDVVAAHARATERVDSLEDQIKDLHLEMRDRDRDWAARLAESLAKPQEETDNLRALEALLDADDPPVEGAIPRTALTDYLSFMNGGDTEDKIHWERDYTQPAGEDKDES